MLGILQPAHLLTQSQVTDTIVFKEMKKEIRRREVEVSVRMDFWHYRAVSCRHYVIFVYLQSCLSHTEDIAS